MREDGGMSFAEAIQSVFSKFNKLQGRSPRSEYWYWRLFVFIVSLVAVIPVVLVAMMVRQGDVWALFPFLIAAGAIAVFLWLLTITVTVRRLHDQGVSGWFFLLFLIPSVGWIIELVFMLQPSQPGSNKYGAPYLAK
ncbi:uncharacterized membrane protein YhaH (DUF805 family) [Aurantimicrobium minutum]|nr:uncharacterized membrane protein YhaH (DUF805 family) [Aurantimicrobium minutum]